MGCFNTVYFDCPNCKETISEQTKNGDCSMQYKHIEDADLADVQGISGYPIKCYECNHEFIVKTKFTMSYTIINHKKEK